jgi:hypothetical protein
MKLRCLIPNFCVHVRYLEAIYIFPQMGLIWISIFLYSMRELWAQSQEQIEGQGTAAYWLAAVPYPALRFCG